MSEVDRLWFGLGLLIIALCGLRLVRELPAIVREHGPPRAPTDHLTREEPDVTRSRRDPTR